MTSHHANLPYRNLTRIADYLSAALEKIGFIIMSQRSGHGLPLVAFRIDPKLELGHDEFAVAHVLRERGWVVPAYTMAPHSDKLKLMRIVVREDFSRSRCDALIKDFKLAVDELKKTDVEWQKQHQGRMQSKTSRVPEQSAVSDKHKDDHSLQGQHGKSHPIC